MLDDRCLVKWETSDPENEQGQEILRIARELVSIANSGQVPVVLDPFAGGGAIPLKLGGWVRRQSRTTTIPSRISSCGRHANFRRSTASRECGTEGESQ